MVRILASLCELAGKYEHGISSQLVSGGVFWTKGRAGDIWRGVGESDAESVHPGPGRAIAQGKYQK